jgi:thioredoxin-dependent peroxiredoxin
MPTKKSDSVKSKDSHQLEGKKAPTFELQDASGERRSLKDLTSKRKLVLYFYPRDMTPGCTTEACSFRDNIDALRRAGAEVVGVSGDSGESHQKFIKAHALNFPLLSDPGNEVAKKFGVWKEKSMYGRKFMGIERSTFVIDRDGVVRKAFPKVKVNGHTAEVLAALKEIG